MYIIFEGIDTCGKSTQIELLQREFQDAIITKEPGGTPFGIKAREILLDAKLSKRAELLLFLSDRAEHYTLVIEPNRDRLILSDRGFLSGIGYALANGDFDFEELVRLNRFALKDSFPDKIILFITDKKTLLDRMDTKRLDGIELRGIEYLLLVQEKMRESLDRLDIPHLIVDARDDIESIKNSIYRYIR
jgi:dTMP kinase